MKPDRFKLLFGPYVAPPFDYGDTVSCKLSGQVEIVGLTDALIPWPIGRRDRWKSIVLYGSLADAVRRESNQAVAHWWGVSLPTVSKWRRTLGVEPITEGTHWILREKAFTPSGRDALRKMHAKARDPVRIAKISAANRGKKLSMELRRRLSEAHRGKQFSDEHRRKLSEVNKRRGARPPAAGVPWSAAEDALINLSPAEVMRLTGRSIDAVYHRRRILGLTPAGRRQ